MGGIGPNFGYLDIVLIEIHELHQFTNEAGTAYKGERQLPPTVIKPAPKDHEQRILLNSYFFANKALSRAGNIWSESLYTFPHPHVH